MYKTSMTDKYEITQALIETGCLKISPNNPFTYASGLQGPLYCDNRLLLSHPGKRDLIIKGFEDLVRDSLQDIDHFAGLATAGIPYSSILADRLDKSLVYIRSKAKGHGKGKQIEGDFKKGQSIFLVEDLVNQGSSLLKAIDAAEAEKLDIKGCICIVDYQTDKAREILERKSLTMHSLTNLDAILSVSKDLLKLSDEEISKIESWRRDPKSWSS